MIFRRFVVLAVAGVIALAPGAGHSLADDSAPVAYTTCMVGGETLTYDPVEVDWVASSTISCANSYPQLALNVSVVLVQPLRNSVAIPASGVICLVCPAVQHRINRGGPWLTNGIYQVRSTASISVPTQSWMVGEHFSCFLVNGSESKLLMAGCPKIN